VSDIIYGIHPILEAIKSGKEIEKVFIRQGMRNEHIFELQQLVTQQSIPMQYLPEESLNRITRKNHQGIVALISPIEYQNIEAIVPSLFENGKNPFILILDRITDVRNFGAIARTAECAGVDAIIFPAKGAARISSDTVKTSAGAIHSIPICRVPSLRNTTEFLKNSGLQLVAASEKRNDKTREYYNIDYTPPTAIIFGSEEDGISDNVLILADYIAQIPVLGTIQSLNVSVATGIVLYEAIKQRATIKV